MKIVFSRKGFDTQYGGIPSAVLPDQTLVSFPIEDKKSIVTADTIRRGGNSIGEMVEQLSEGRIQRNYRAHLDPDLDPSAYPRERGWRPVLGQTGSPLGHLRKQGVGAGALFLFFGWYRQVEQFKTGWAYERGTAPVHSLWGWLHVGACLDHQHVPKETAQWLAYHPHLQRSARKKHVLFMASDHFDINGRRVLGGGVFPRFRSSRVLSAPGANMSLWQVPDWMHPDAGQAAFSYIYEEKRWRHLDSGLATVQTIGKGQEIVMDADATAPVFDWIAALFEDVPSLTQ